MMIEALATLIVVNFCITPLIVFVLTVDNVIQTKKQAQWAGLAMLLFPVALYFAFRYVKLYYDSLKD